MEEAVRAGLHDIVIVTSRAKHAIEDHFDRSIELEYDLERAGKHDELKQMRAIAELAAIHYVRQPEPRGLGHAVAMARHHVGGEPFAVLLPDDLFHERAGVLADMVAVYQRRASSVLALKEVAPAEISAYGCAAVEPIEDRLVRVTGVVEKPEPENAPSNLAVVGRYVLTPEIFDALDHVQPGKGGEIQLTDAVAAVMAEQDVYGWTFQHGRYDTGNKLDFLRANVELAMERDDLGPPLRAILSALLERNAGE